MKNNNIFIRMSDNEKKQIVAIAKAKGENLSETVRKALEEYAQKNK